jgi:hypothetical protein
MILARYQLHIDFNRDWSVRQIEAGEQVGERLGFLDRFRLAVQMDLHATQLTGRLTISPLSCDLLILEFAEPVSRCGAGGNEKASPKPGEA